MSDTVISVENVSKSYRLGVIGTGTFFGDLNRWWAKKLGRPDPYAKIGEKDHGNRQGETILALHDINFDIQQGEALGIIGRNGAGKSTLLKIFSRVTAPTSGAVKVKGRIASLLEVGTGFHPELTGRENIYLNGAILGMSRTEVNRKLEEIIDFSGVENFIDTPVKRYSSGMYVRLAFSVAAHLEPDILVVDEVLAVGDLEFQNKCLGRMGEVAQGGRTVIFVSHNMGAISRFCSRVVLLQKGGVVMDGATQKVIDAYHESLQNKSKLLDGDRVVNSPMGFTRWSVGEDSGGMLFQTQSQKPLTISFRLSVSEPIKQAHFGLAIYSTDGQLIWAIKSADVYNEYMDFDRGVYEIKFRIPSLPLREGHYMLKVSANSRFKQFDVWDVEPVLDVVSKTDSILPSRWQGILNIPCEIDVTSVEKK